jgi:hypothetical protein
MKKGENHLMENNFIKKAIKKTSINSGLLFIFVISIITLVLFNHKNSISSILGAPKEISTIEDIDEYNLTREGHITLNLEYMADSGYYIAKDGGKGAITDNIYIGIIDGKFITIALPAKSSSKNPIEMENVSIVAKEFDGLNDEDNEELLEQIKGGLAESFGVSIEDMDNEFIGIMFKDSKMNRLLEKIFLIGVFIVVIYLIVLLIKALMAITNYKNSKVIKSLSKYGNIDYIENQIDQEMNYPEHSDKKLIITTNWIISKSAYNVKFMPINNLVWVYNIRTKHYYNGIRTGTSFSVMCYSDKNEKLLFDMGGKKKEDKSIEIVNLISQKAPWAICGYSDEIKKDFKKNPQKIIEEVRNIKMENSL